MATIEERLRAIEQEHTQFKQTEERLQVLEQERTQYKETTERLQVLEQEHTQLKKTAELQTIAIGALVNKATLEQLNEKYDRIFEALMAHDRFTNEQLAELRGQQIEEDGKIVGLQTEMRQRFTEQDGKITGLQTEMRQQFAEHTRLLERILTRLSE